MQKQLLIKDKIKGLFYGQAIGDAIGLATEFLTKEEVTKIYPHRVNTYSDIHQDDHRVRWLKGDWTDDTDQFLAIVDSIIKTKNVDEFAFAKELIAWFNECPMGIGNTVLKVLKIPGYTSNPHKAAELIWKQSRENVASNGAIMRTSVLGAFQYWDVNQVISNTIKICKTTHSDPRCIGSCVIISLIISNILRENNFLTINDIKNIAKNYDDRILKYIDLSLTTDINELDLNNDDDLGYTLKTLSAGLWAYFNRTNFTETISEIIHQGGDADTNAAVAGSLLGVIDGYETLPTPLIEGLIYKNVLNQKFEDFYQLNIK
ncbi:MAG: ADP-ribosylglycohydrolase family protein [Weeksellaceae bacterium]|nr:ADP-ribosylglycohydrolase family protein [Weeksellaceae bacterium]